MDSYPYGPPSASGLGRGKATRLQLARLDVGHQRVLKSECQTPRRCRPPHCTWTSHEADSLSVRLVRRGQVLPAGRGQGKQDAREFLVSLCPVFASCRLLSRLARMCGFCCFSSNGDPRRGRVADESQHVAWLAVVTCRPQRQSGEPPHFLTGG